MERPRGPGGETETFNAEDASREQGAVENFDQLGAQGSEESQREGQEESLTNLETRRSGQGAMGLMEQWLEQAEGNPAYLLRNQFLLDEQRAVMSRTAPLREPRPW